MDEPLKKPMWVTDLVLSLISAVAKLLVAKTDTEHEEALMSAAEATKVAADRRKFGE